MVSAPTNYIRARARANVGLYGILSYRQFLCPRGGRCGAAGKGGGRTSSDGRRVSWPEVTGAGRLYVACAWYKEDRDIWKQDAEDWKMKAEAERVYQEQDRQVLRLFEG